MLRRWGRVAVVLAGWTLLASVFAVSSSLTYMIAYRPPQWRQTFTMAFTEWYVWAAMTPLVVWVARRLMLRRGRWVARAAVLAALGLPVAMIKVTLTRVLRGLAGPEEYFLISNLTTHYLIYWGIIGIVHAVENYRAGRERELRAAQLEARLAEARMQLLKMQLQPHFLFNTLNAISELVHEDPHNAEKMIGGLSHLLRQTLDAGMIDTVPLAQELDLLDRYTTIQRARFGDRLDVRVSVEPREAREALVPVLILQPLVENAIRHGIAQRARAGRIDVRARRSGGRLILEVQDDGVGPGDGDHREGVGLGNTRARLAALYGDDQSFDLAGDSRGAVARVSLPWQTEDGGTRAQ
jgi:two-component system LytT family sensor kinase